MNLRSIYERLHLAIASLATSPHSLQKRLQYVYLSIHNLKEEDFPEELREDFRWIYTEGTKVSGSQGTFAASTAAMSDEQAEAVAKQIFQLYSSVARLYFLEKTA